MITDALARFLSGTALNTGAAGTYVIGDVYDLKRDNELHDVEGIYLVAQMATTATSGGSATLTVQFVTADNAALTTNPVVLVASAAVPVADLTAGKRIIAVPLPKGAGTKRYLGVRQVTGTAAFTGGTISAFLTNEPSNYRSFADALTSAQ